MASFRRRAHGGRPGVARRGHRDGRPRAASPPVPGPEIELATLGYEALWLSLEATSWVKSVVGRVAREPNGQWGGSVRCRGEPLAVHRLARPVALVFGAQLWAAPVMITPAGDLEGTTEPAAIARRVSRYIPACNLGRIGRHSGNAGFWRAAARVRARYTELRRRIKQFKIDRVRRTKRGDARHGRIVPEETSNGAGIQRNHRTGR